MTFVSFTLNGRRQEVPEGTTILEAARASGIFIPTFCSDERLEPFASCFICVVEIAGRGTLAPACSTVVQEGMDVLSESERVLAARRFCLEFLRGDYAEPWLLGFTSAQATSAGFMLVCLGFFLYFGYLAKNNPERMMLPPDHHLGGK